MSPLARWFDQHPDRRRIELARFAGITPSFVTQLCNGSSKPGLTLAVRIAEWTANEVRPEHWAEPGPARGAQAFTTADRAPP